MNDLFKYRILPLLLLSYLLSGFAIITAFSPWVRARIASDTREVLEYHARSSAEIFSALDAQGQTELFSDPGLAINSLAPDSSAGSQDRMPALTRYYRIDDVLVRQNLLSSLPEIQQALEMNSGFALRRGAESGDQVYAFALSFGPPDERILLHSVLAHRRAAEIQSFLSILVSGILSAGLTLSLAGIIGFMQSYQSSLDTIHSGINTLKSGNIPPRLSSGPAVFREIGRGIEELASEQQKNIRFLEQQRGELAQILTAMKDGIILINEREEILLINDAACEFFAPRETRPEDCVGKAAADSLRNSELNRILEDLVRSKSSNTQQLSVYDRRRGRYRSLEMHGLFIASDQPQGSKILLAFHDISEIVRLEQVRRDFVSNVSHELKTPITTIQGFAETLEQGAVDDSSVARNFLSIIIKQSRRMESIVSDLLTLSRLEQQGEEPQTEKTNIASLLGDVKEICAGRAAERNITVHSSVSGLEHAQINANLIEQAVTNLVDNAIKYGKPGGSVWINAEISREDLTLIVRDDGPGIPGRDLPRLFERFYRVDKGRSSSMGGTGLGLAIVKHIVNAHGGSVRADSVVGEGSSFSMIIPLV